MRRTMFRKLSCLVCVAFVTTSGTAGDASKKTARGITVGAPKVFDNRTLTLMLERLNKQLAGITILDQTSVAKAIGGVQGSRIQEISRALTVQGSPTPSLGSEVDTNSSLAPPATVPTTSISTKQTSSTPSITPAIPALPDLNATPTALANLQYGMSASDLLGEQVDLTYEIINLRMLLDRSLSDRLLNPDLKPRLQAVVGLNVSLDPPRDAENAVAVVEITLRRDDQCVAASTCDDSPSLVAAIPQEHTYNSVALNSKSSAFGGSAVMKLVTVGYTERRRGQTYYMFRDNDTVSFEKQSTPHAGAVTFGWAFRPVLGRKSVAPGLRQMLAVVSLPSEDDPNPKKLAFSKNDPNPKEPDYRKHFLVDVKAYWRKYDPGSLTSADHREIRPWSKVGHVLSLGTLLTYAPEEKTESQPYDLYVPVTASYFEALSPQITSVSWRPVGTRQAVIAIRGQNLFQETQVAMGDKVLSSVQDGLRLVSDQGLDITTDSSVLFADAAVLGRYGPAIPLEQSPDPSFAKKNMSLSEATFSPALGGYVQLRLLPRFDKTGCLSASDMEDKNLGQPIVFMNGTPIPGPYAYPSASGDEKAGDCLAVQVRIPETLMPKLSGVATLKFPFRAGYSASQRLYDPNGAYKLQVLRSGSDYLVQRLDGPFVPPGSSDVSSHNWRLLAADDPPLMLSDKCPDSPTKNANVFCLLTSNDNLARFSIGKTYPCPDGSDANTSNSPTNASRNSAQTSRLHVIAPQPAPKPKSCAPKIVILQQASSMGGGALHWQASYPLSIPSESDIEKPNLDAKQIQTVNQHDQVWVSFTGTGLSAVGGVLVSNTKLETNASKDGKSISVFLPKSVTKDAASVDLTFVDKQGSQLGTAHVVIKPNVTGGSK